MRPAARLLALADELRAIATNGLHWSTDEHDRARYGRTLTIAAELLSLADTRDAAEIERVFRGDLALRSPFVSVDAAVFDQAGRLLLIQRSDHRTWAMPGGAAEVGETPAQAAVREVREETGLDIRVTHLLGIYDSRRVGSPDVTHLYHLVFRGAAVGGQLVCTPEAIAVEYVGPQELMNRPLHPGHGARIADAFRAERTEAKEALFQ